MCAFNKHTYTYNRNMAKGQSNLQTSLLLLTINIMISTMMHGSFHSLGGQRAYLQIALADSMLLVHCQTADHHNSYGLSRPVVAHLIAVHLNAYGDLPRGTYTQSADTHNSHRSFRRNNVPLLLYEHAMFEKGLD